jgi:hypothetical protein
MIINPDPAYISAQDWAAALIDSIPETPIPAMTGAWQDWAVATLRLPYFEQFSIPSPSEGDSWDTWSQVFYRFLQATT